MPTKQQDDLLVDFDQQRKNKKSVVIRTYEKKKGIIKIKVRSKSVWFASACFLACLQVCVVPKFLSVDFEMPPKTFSLKKPAIKVHFKALAAGWRLKFEPKIEIFVWGVRFILISRQLDVLGPFWGLFCICEAWKKWPSAILFQNAWNLLARLNAFKLERPFSNFQGGTRFQILVSFSRIFVCHICFHKRFVVFLRVKGWKRCEENGVLNQHLLTSSYGFQSPHSGIDMRLFLSISA